MRLLTDSGSPLPETTISVEVLVAVRPDGRVVVALVSGRIVPKRGSPVIVETVCVPFGTVVSLLPSPRW